MALPVFGRGKNLVVPDDSGGVPHAQLSFSDVMMLGSVRDNEWGRFIKQPDEISGAATQSIYLVVPDADVTYETNEERRRRNPNSNKG